MSSSARLFLALYPDGALRAALAGSRDSWAWTRSAALVADDKLHLTLHFIGDVPRDMIEELRALLCVPVAPFELAFGASTVWPHGIAVLEPLSAPPALLELHRLLGERLAYAGFTPEARTYKPHVTMARRAGASTPPAHSPSLHWQADGYALMESAGSRYTVLETYPI